MMHFWESMGIGVMVLLVMLFLHMAMKIGKTFKYVWKLRTVRPEWPWVMLAGALGMALCAYAIGKNILWCAECTADVLGIAG